MTKVWAWIMISLLVVKVYQRYRRLRSIKDKEPTLSQSKGFHKTLNIIRPIRTIKNNLFRMPILSHVFISGPSGKNSPIAAPLVNP